MALAKVQVRVKVSKKVISDQCGLEIENYVIMKHCVYPDVLYIPAGIV